jgi:hypothetical protein
MKKTLLTLAGLLVLVLLAVAGWYFNRYRPGKIPAYKLSLNDPAGPIQMTRLRARAAIARQYVLKNQYNPQLVLLADMHLESGRNRLFLYDLQADSILLEGMVTQGSCGAGFLFGHRFGNQPGCHCSSLGRYRIGSPYYGRFGRAYKLYGLDSTNSNALKRAVVLHSMACIPEQEVYPFPICQSNGCPAVSPGFLQKLSAIIDRSPRPILLELFY